MLDYIQGVPGATVTTSGFNFKADSESKTLYIHGSNSQRFWSYGVLKYRLHMAAGYLGIRVRKFIQAYGEHFKQFA
jgi:hypothetical protein